ncbi:hypothetical protein Ga0466249_002229 [Sporomusaceae bacterium BoRhaA]|uniref:hypothetical protein n=1 Tax=Pelorhabdus rhamnosifermentans TaxID=2772457 RepID=UPI001C0625A3|nr:hypothetical protein [Pelorhabdus rhamnosifermentans]MBU2701118.1 hypothetical protein [Pelorhabdus rhamnosifermentans]
MKSENRVKGYRKGTEDWNAEYNMLLDDEVTCKQCIHCERCCGIFGQEETGTRCQFYPNKFRQKNHE